MNSIDYVTGLKAEIEKKKKNMWESYKREREKE